MDLTVEGKNTAEVKIQRGIFQGDTQSTLVFAIPMAYSITFLRNAQPDRNRLDCKKRSMNGIKLFAKNERELETLVKTVRIYNQDIERCSMRVMKSGKEHMTEGIKLPNPEKI